MLIVKRLENQLIQKSLGATQPKGIKFTPTKRCQCTVVEFTSTSTIDHINISDLILKLFIFTRLYGSYFPLKQSKRSNFIKNFNENKIYFSHNM